MKDPTATCGDRLPGGLTCDRELGHPGPHRGHLVEHDEPIFWYDAPDDNHHNPPGVSGFPSRSRGPTSDPQS